MRPRTCLLLVIAGLCVVWPKAHAEEAPTLETISLSAALSEAASKSPELLRALAEVRGAAGLALAARGAFDLELELGGSKARKVIPRLGPDDFSGGSSSETAYRLELSRRLETGGRLSIGIGGVADASDSFLECGFIESARRSCILHGLNAALTLTQPLLRGAGPGVARAEIRQRDLERDVAALSRRARAAIVMRDVIIAFGQLDFAHRSLAIQKAGLELAREQLRNTERQVAVGKRAAAETAAAEQVVSASETARITAEEDTFARSLALRELLGVENPVPMKLLLPEGGPPLPDGLFDEAALVARASDRNPQLVALRLGRKLNDIEVETARSLLLPKLDVEASVGSVARATGFSPALSQLRARENLIWMAGLSFAFPLQDRAGRGQLARARATREGQDVTVESQARELRNQVLRLANTIRSGLRRLELAKKTAGFAEVNARAEKNRYLLGQSTSNEVLRIQHDLRLARLAVAAATLELTTSAAWLDALTGDVLERHRVELPERD
jgi:outer membrane protein